MRLLDDAPPDRVSLAWLIGRLGKRSFGLLMLIVAFLGLAPAIAMLAMLLLPFPAIQMVMGHERPSLPQFLARRSISTQRLSRLAVQSIPFIKAHGSLHPPALAYTLRVDKTPGGIDYSSFGGNPHCTISIQHSSNFGYHIDLICLP